MKSLCFDSGPIISLAMGRLLWILKPLKEHFGGKFYITPSVRRELVERPLKIKRFQFEALEVIKLLKEGVIEVYDTIPQNIANKLDHMANKTYTRDGRPLKIIHSGEIETVACAMALKNHGIVMDERTTRLLIEKPTQLKKLLGRRLHTSVQPIPQNIKEFTTFVGKIKIIRSIELVAAAYKLGILNDYIPALRNGKSTLLDAVLWGTKYNGCAVTENEILEIKKTLLTS
ncbi:MAG: hypothetical protein CMH61_00565 [Nanoarchaeota archaeon]|nr:hypothetical protein [Nanoarchaeota archaeon]|tara:strand:- start:1019 stop:1708 length:690 start_codon:yes stop_codon:yes gene_type:complete